MTEFWMREQMIRAFVQTFHRPPGFGARAPGRVNLIGEHTDYNEGWVLPCAIDRDTWVLGAHRSDGRFRVAARDLDEVDEFDGLGPRRRGGWIDYLQGVVWELRRRGVALRGSDLLIGSRVPRESGLSSSAALGVATAAALDAGHGLGWSALEWARVALAAEREFVGVACGIMDPFASALGRRDCALLIDCRSQDTRLVPASASDFVLLVADSGVRRSLAASGAGYAERVAECHAALDAARSAGVVPCEARALRDLHTSDLPALESALNPRLFRRARHVVSENERVSAVCTRLEAASRSEPGALQAVGERLKDGQRSLRDDFEVSTPELDALCAIADRQPGVYGSRLTGAGFGGCTLHLVAGSASQRLERVLASEFERRFGRRPEIWEVHPADGASLVEGL
jgi:galactokinase